MCLASGLALCRVPARVYGHTPHPCLRPVASRRPPGLSLSRCPPRHRVEKSRRCLLCIHSGGDTAGIYADGASARRRCLIHSEAGAITCQLGPPGLTCVIRHQVVDRYGVFRPPHIQNDKIQKVKALESSQLGAAYAYRVFLTAFLSKVSLPDVYK